VIAYFCLHKLHMLPSQFTALPSAEKAFIFAAVELKAEHEKKMAEEMKSK
jgi:hypothetical protein